jgi:hypothetical protein
MADAGILVGSYNPRSVVMENLLPGVSDAVTREKKAQTRLSTQDGIP